MRSGALTSQSVHTRSVTCRCAFKAWARPSPFTHNVTRKRTAGVHSTDLLRVKQGSQHHQLLSPPRAAEEEPSVFDYVEPETAKEGIDLGLVMCKQGRWKDAMDVFEQSLKLPGTGVKRFRDKPRLISDGEKQTLLYNIACCHSQLQDARSGLVALAGCMEAGYTEFGQVRKDPDLEFLRADSRFEGLMERFEKKPGGFLGFDLSGVFGQK